MITMRVMSADLLGGKGRIYYANGTLEVVDFSAVVMT